MCRNLQNVINLLDIFCLRHGLSINPNKTRIVLFTRRRALNCLWFSRKRGRALLLSEQVKILRVILDKKLPASLEQTCRSKDDRTPTSYVLWPQISYGNGGMEVKVRQNKYNKIFIFRTVLLEKLIN